MSGTVSANAVIVTVSVNVSVVTGIVSTDVITPPPVTSCDNAQRPFFW